MSLSIGETVDAKVESIRGYGVILRCRNEEIIVLLPDISPTDRKNVLDSIEINQTLKVKLLRRNDQTNQLVGKLVGSKKSDD